MRLPLLSRLLIVIALAALLSSTIAFFFGAKLESTYKFAVPFKQGETVIVAFSPIMSRAQVRLKLRGVSEALVARTKVSPREFTGLLSVSGAVRDLSTRTDVSGGAFYLWGSLSGLEAVLSLAKRFGNFTQVRADKDEISFSEELDAGATLIILARPSSSILEVEVNRKTLGYERLTLLEALALSLALLVASLALTSLSLLRDRHLINRLS